MDVKAQLDRVKEEAARLKFDLFQLDNRRGELVQEILKLQGQMELLEQMNNPESRGQGNAGQNP